MSTRTRITPELIQEKIAALQSDPSPLAAEYIGLATTFLSHLSRTEKVMGIADRYLADLKKTSEELIRSREEVRENEEKFVSIFEKNPDPILILDSSSAVLEYNRAFKEVFLSPDQDIRGEDLERLNICPDPQKLRAMLADIGSGSTHTERRLKRQTGVPFTAEVGISRITLHHEPCLIIQIHDIDEIRRAHDAVAQVNQKLKILSSITRHDILNRVMVTSAYSEMLLEELSDEKMVHKLRAINQSSTEIKNLIQFTGQYQEMGTEEPAWQQIGVILKTATIRGLIQGITLNSDLGDLEIYADLMLEKVIYNLVENSVRHGSNLTWIGFSAECNRGELVIRYEDDGGGVSADEKEKIFQKGFGKNTGLGLFLIREILSITGMTILETGEPGKGVRFEIRVPAGRWRGAGPTAEPAG